MQVVTIIFWGVLVLSILVFLHEGGHYLVARLFNVRVTEFFLGMPSPIKLSHKSKKYGTEVGVTPILLGGYNRICGMEGEIDELLPDALAYIQTKGRISATELSEALSIDTDRAWRILVTLSDWASIEPYYDKELGEIKGQRTYPSRFQTVKRDSNFLTQYDKEHSFEQAPHNEAGDPRPIEVSADEFYKLERSHTYQGCSYLKRIAMLVAGPLVNILLAYLLVVISFMTLGVEYAVNSNVMGGITPGSYAEKAGLVAGDAIVSINDVVVGDWLDIINELDKVLVPGNSFDVSFEHDGALKTAHVVLDADTQKELLFGIQASTELYHPSFLEASNAALSYAGQVASFAVQLITPSKTMDVIEQSSSVVGISVMAADAAHEGLQSLLLLIASVSMSLGFMNLLPIPPLDGGKILIETIQLIIRKPLSTRAQNIVSYVGLAFFLFIFVFALRNDIVRLLG